MEERVTRIHLWDQR